MHTLPMPSPALTTPATAGAPDDPGDCFASSAPRYCPTALLASFALLMAGRGRCINTDMMLGDREYALWQLACARAVDDAELNEVSGRLSAYFDDRGATLPVMGTA